MCTTKSIDILKKVQEFFIFENINVFDFKKKISVTNDGAPAMLGKHAGFLRLLQKKLAKILLLFYCIIYKENFKCKGLLKTVKRGDERSNLN